MHPWIRSGKRFQTGLEVGELYWSYGAAQMCIGVLDYVRQYLPDLIQHKSDYLHSKTPYVNDYSDLGRRLDLQALSKPTREIGSAWKTVRGSFRRG